MRRDGIQRLLLDGKVNGKRNRGQRITLLCLIVGGVRISRGG